MTAAAFAPFGEALTWLAAEADASGPGWNWCAERLRTARARSTWPRRASPAGRICPVITVSPGEVVLLHSGVWHGTPLAAGGSALVLILLPEGTGRDETLKVTFDLLLLP